MKSKLTYLLEELDNWDKDKPIKVKDLKRMIEKVFIQCVKDEEAIQNSMNEIGHDMP